MGMGGNVPAAFQARIGGAKGLWIVDTLGEKVPGQERWIEITDSQLKYPWHQIDEAHADRQRMTFEVVDFSRPLRPAALTFQLMLILLDRGVPEHIFIKLAREDMTEKTEQIEAAMVSGLALRLWNQQTNPTADLPLGNDSLEMLAGFPLSTVEQINRLTEACLMPFLFQSELTLSQSGFVPKEYPPLYELCYKTVDKFWANVVNRLKISLGRSTSAFMIPDPLAVLEENEIHLGFSNSFSDPKSGFSDVMLHDMDVLVARLPAHFSSDIQKVYYSQVHRR